MEKRISYWADIFMYFQKITKVTVRGTTIKVFGFTSKGEDFIETTYQHKKVASAVAKKLRNISGI